MEKFIYKELLDVGVYFGYLKKKWNFKMFFYIFMECKGIYIIDINWIMECMDNVVKVLYGLVKFGKKIMFVVIKK